MAENKKQFDPDHLFNILKLNKWFAIVSILLLLGVVGLIKKDYDRDWKNWQRKFRSLEIKNTKDEITKVSEDLKNSSEYQEAQAKLDSAGQELKKNEIDLFKLKKELADHENTRFKTDRVFRDLKSVTDSLRYELDEAKHHNDRSVNRIATRLKKKEAELQVARAKKEAAEAVYNKTQSQINELTASTKAAQAELNKASSDLTRLKKKERAIGRSFVNDVLRDAPLLDFIDPSLKVKEIIVDDLYDDYNFAKIKRIDSCTTCHVAIDKVGYEDQPNPLKTHPKLDVYLSSRSPHPIQEYGCTICHGGMGGSLDFVHAGHAPKNEAQAKEWEKKYHWHPLKHWDDPMLPLQYTQANCLGCHKKEIDVPKGDRINQAIFLVERSGCVQCHKVEGWHLKNKPGPTLRKISSKVSEEWLSKWIRNPKSFRPTTAMPRFFDLTNTKDYESKARSSVQVAGIVSYLKSKAQPYEPPSVSLEGASIEQGKQLFGDIGCLGCHSIDDYPKIMQPQFGPDLSDVGSKLSANWIAAWLKNPKQYWPDSRMPNMRLSESEIKHLTSYLLSKRNTAFEEQKLQKADPRVIDKTTLEFLKARMTLKEAQEKAASMSKEEKLHFIGERTIAHYGCYSCHDIDGFENAKPIGVELTLEASKPLPRFDFGFVDIPKNLQSWIYQKLMEPRIFDTGKEKAYLDRLRMPQFDFTPEQAELVTTFVLGLKKDDTPLHRKPSYDNNIDRIHAGRALLHENNCRGCHIVEDMGGRILANYESARQGPPNLKGVGQKLQPDWFYQFLKAPSVVRPWLNVRMPTFGFSDHDNNALINYFRALDRQTQNYETIPELARSGDHYMLGKKTFETYQCQNCHKSPPYPPDTDMENMAPPLTLVPKRLRYEWVDDWLRDPQKLMPGTGMPGFFYYDGKPMTPESEDEVKAVRDYLYVR